MDVAFNIFMAGGLLSPNSNNFDKKWYEKPAGILFLTVTAGLIIALLRSKFWWT